MKQWHPIFAQLLRPLVEDYYEVQTTVPVGDAPREADILLLRRLGRGTPPFQGLWRHLTSWNVLEFKGPTVSPRRGDVELLVELGLGIDRRLRRTVAGGRSIPEAAVSFWYLANRLGTRFIHNITRRMRVLEQLGPGLWRGELLGRGVYWASSVDLPVEPDALPLHIVGQEPLEKEREAARLIAARPELQTVYSGWMASLHAAAWKEVEEMARTKGKPFVLDVRPAIESLGLKKVIEQVGLDRVIEAVGRDRVIEAVGMEKLMENVDERDVIKHFGVRRLFANLSPADRRELKRQLEAE